jgi:hypothetical protein
VRFAAMFMLVSYPLLASSEEPVAATLCAISAAPETYANRLVRVYARVLSDGLERTVLVDVAPKCRYGGAGLSMADGIVSPAFDKITDTILSGKDVGTTNKFIRANFVGIFRSSENRRTLEVRSISNLRITFYGSERQ